jgi:hypothetical protein
MLDSLRSRERSESERIAAWHRRYQPAVNSLAGRRFAWRPRVLHLPAPLQPLLESATLADDPTRRAGLYGLPLVCKMTGGARWCDCELIFGLLMSIKALALMAMRAPVPHFQRDLFKVNRPCRVFRRWSDQWLHHVVIEQSVVSGLKPYPWSFGRVALRSAPALAGKDPGVPASPRGCGHV